ncbi:hypothetical protein MLD38_039320 [Melastoma candidum]|uniref:Uncharacterized protein n=1 Tax=Melastoma candidum TaxID=119954 RepID=A0ACB9L253_9MYRT|nr:hypothetical protein MLD38_039320 [Melastoma candidum]
MKIQPVDFEVGEGETKPAAAKSRLKRLLERQFTSMLRIPSLEKLPSLEKVSSDEEMVEIEPSSVFLRKMVRNYLEESNCDKNPALVRYGGRNRCNCFNGNGSDSSDDEVDFFCGYGSKSSECKCDLDILKGLVICSSANERNLLEDVAQTMEKQRACKWKDLFPASGLLGIVDELVAIGYDASVHKCCWAKSLSTPAGEYESISVVIQGEKIVVDVDFRSQFEIARPTKKYKSILSSLPAIFVGKEDRLGKIIAIVLEATKQSLKKRGMPIPPWRKTEYIRAKWFSKPLPRLAPSEEETSKVTERDHHGEFPDPPPLFFAEAKPKSVQMGVARVSGLTSVIEA